MDRTSSSSSIAPLSTPTTSHVWGQHRPVEVHKQLYPRAQAALKRLRTIPGFSQYEELATLPGSTLPPHLRPTIDITPEDMPIDPVSIVLRCLRMGAPLCLVFNALNPKTKLEVLSVDDCKEIKLVKKSIYRFCESCVQELKFKWDTDLFTISQVFHDGTSEIMKPLHTLESVLSKLPTVSPQEIEKEVEKEVPEPNPSNKLSMVCDELLQTERKYVHDLEILELYRNEMLKISIPRETVAVITPGLGKMLDLQRRFLAGCEYQIRLKPEEQNFGYLFLHLRQEFDIYKVYTLGQKEATQAVSENVQQLMPLSYIMEPVYELPATLLKPVQRIMRYPLLLKNIAKHMPKTWPYHQDLASALDAMHTMMVDVNETQRMAENEFISQDLQERVKDWKGLDFESMGSLLLNGAFPANAEGESEQEYNLYLFERMLVCCKDRVYTKKTPLTKMRTATVRSSQGKSMTLDLKGRIYLEYISDVQLEKFQVGYLLRLVWGHRNDASEMGHFDIRLSNEEAAQMWKSTLDKLVAMNKQRFNNSSFQDTVNGSGSGSYQSQSSNSNGTPQFNSRYSTGARFWDDSPGASSPIDALRKLSVSSTSSQQTVNSLSGTSGGSRTSYTHAQRPLSMQGMQGVQGMQGMQGNRTSRANLVFPDSPSSMNMSVSAGQRRVRIHINDDSFLILIPQDIGFDQLQSRVERKLRLCGKLPPPSLRQSELKFTYRDEDDDLVSLESNEDLQLALDSVNDRQELVIYVQ